VERAKSPTHLPVVFTPRAVKSLLAHISGTNWLMAGLLYRSGLRLQECVTLRVEDVDFGYGQIAIHDGKGRRAG
jgi:integrase